MKKMTDAFGHIVSLIRESRQRAYQAVLFERVVLSAEKRSPRVSVLPEALGLEICVLELQVPKRLLQAKLHEFFALNEAQDD